MPSREPTRVWSRDVLEILGLLAVPPLVLGAGFAVFGGEGRLVRGLQIGGILGYLSMSVRRRYRAVRTEDGIERRRHPVENAWWVRVANVEYDEKYDRALAVVLGVVGVGAFLAIPFVDPDDRTILRLTMVGLFGVTTSLMTYASLDF